jgi:1-acyl-sn-glycerol-3-phosphate acyltransferase
MVTRDSKARRKYGKKLLKGCFQLFSWIMQFLGVIELRIEGLQHLKTGRRLVLANHPSLIDAVILISLIENPNGIIKSSLLKNPSMFGLAKVAGLICNVEGPELVRKSIESISSGDNLLIFPEGTRTKEPNKSSFKRGAAYIAIRGKINIIPVFISISVPFLKKGHSWYEVPSIKPIYDISIGDEIEVASKVNIRGDLILESELLTEYLEELYAHELS